jgi:hypothetical protein
MPSGVADLDLEEEPGMALQPKLLRAARPGGRALTDLRDELTPACSTIRNTNAACQAADLSAGNCFANDPT